MNLEVGMYIRPKDGLDGIGILKEIDGLSLKVEFKNYVVTNTANYYKKASYEPIDLIEVGDYVNGEKVILVQKYSKHNIGKQGIHLIITHSYDINDDNQYLIETIMTKEQFEKYNFKMEEENV